MAAGTGLGGATANTGFPAAALPSVPLHQSLRSPHLYVPVEACAGGVLPRQAAGRGRRRRLPAIAGPVSAQRFLYVPLSALNGFLLSSSYHISFSVLTPFWFQEAQKK